MGPPDQEKGPDSVGAEIRAGVHDFANRVARYGTAKRRSLDISKYMGEVCHQQQPHIRELFRDTLRVMKSCGEYLVFREYPTLGETRLHAASLCKKHLLCPLCAIRRGAKAFQAYSDRWKVIRAAQPRLRPFMVTLTVKDGVDLWERFQHLHSSQRELWKRRTRGRGSVLDGVAGAVWSYEFKRGSGSGLWHPHIHMIALAENAPSQLAIRDEWHNITGDSYIVDVRPITNGSGDEHIEGFLEVFKYAVKFSDQEPDDTVHAWLTLKGRNLIGSAGCFRGVEVPESLLDEPLGDLPYVEHFFQFLSGKYRAPVGARVHLLECADV